MRFVLVLAMAVALAGCNGKTLVKTVYVDKYIPVAVVPRAEAPVRPVLEINKLTEAEKADDGVFAKAIAASAEQLRGYAKELETILDKYNDLAAASALNLAKLGVPATSTIDTLSRKDWVTKFNWLTPTKATEESK